MSGYPVGLVGESHYQSAIAACLPGDRVRIVYEIGNPYDEDALVVLTRNGAKLGYIARDCWVRAAVMEEGKSCSAKILEVRGETLGVVLEVTINSGGQWQCDYQP